MGFSGVYAIVRARAYTHAMQRLRAIYYMIMNVSHNERNDFIEKNFNRKTYTPSRKRTGFFSSSSLSSFIGDIVIDINIGNRWMNPCDC